MACFTAPTTVAAITTVFRKKIPKEWHIEWFNTMVWGGAIGLAVEHIAHKEIVPWPPFLTAMSNPADTVAMFKEIAAVGIPMTLVITLMWLVMVIIYESFIVSDKASSPSSALEK